MKRLFIVGWLLTVAACADPRNACDHYGFRRGTVAFSQCVQSEVLTQRQIVARSYR